MKAPSLNALQSSFRDLGPEGAKIIRNICRSVDDPESLQVLVERIPQTDAYVRQMHRSPYDGAMWRRTVALHAIDVLIDGHGVEPLGEWDDPPFAPPYEYSNQGDSYATTLIYDRDKDRLFIGCWADVAEKIERDRC